MEMHYICSKGLFISWFAFCVYSGGIHHNKLKSLLYIHESACMFWNLYTYFYLCYVDFSNKGVFISQSPTYVNQVPNEQSNPHALLWPMYHSGLIVGWIKKSDHILRWLTSFRDRSHCPHNFQSLIQISYQSSKWISSLWFIEHINPPNYVDYWT